MTTKSNQTYQVSLNIADYPVRLETSDEAMYLRLNQRYADFLDETQAPIVTIDLTVSPDAQFIEPLPGPLIIESDYQPEGLTYRSYYEEGSVNWKTGRGELELHPDAGVENFLRVVYAWLCLQDGGLLLHAAGLVRNGEGYVFFGPSGAGKTTTTILSADIAEILSDDLVILRCSNGVCTLHGVPFKGDLSDAPRANQQAHLKSIYRIQQDKEHYLETLPNMTAVAELVASSPFVVRDLNLSHQLIDVCRQIAQSVPVQMMHFKKDNGFWKVIDGYDKSIPETAPSNGRSGY